MKKRFFWLTAVLASSRLLGQSIDSLPTAPRATQVELESVIVTANKYPRKQSETGKVVSVISRQQIDESGGKSLGEILNTIPGTLVIGANNTPGTNPTVSIRGSSAGNVLLLLDGIPVNDPSVITNYFDLNLIPLDQVERIEILKGGQSTLYGTDAVAGVINIISRKNNNAKPAINGSLSGGSYATCQGNAGIQGRVKRWGYTLGYNHTQSNGFSSAYDRNKTGNFDKDGYDQHFVNGRATLGLTSKLQAYVSGLFSYYKADLDAAAYADEKDFTVKNKNGEAGAGFSLQHSSGTLRFNYQFNYVNRHYVDDSMFRGSPYLVYSDSRFTGRTQFAELYDNWKWKHTELLAGIDYRYNNTDQYALYIFPGFPGSPASWKAHMWQAAPYASFIVKDGQGLTVELGGRWNHHSEYGDNFSFTFNPARLIGSQAKVFGNLYTAYKVPTLYQLFDPSAGNMVLKPEEGLIIEAGAELFPGSHFHSRLTGFYRNTRNAILYTFDPVTFQGKYLNVSRQQNYGAEFEASYRVRSWDVSLNYTYTDGRTTSAYDGTGVALPKDTSYYNLFRIPRHAVNASVSYRLGKAWMIRAQLRAVSKRQEFIYGSSPETENGYAVLDLYGEYNFAGQFKLFLDLRNITNTVYFDFPGYNCRKFNFITGIRFNL